MKKSSTRKEKKKNEIGVSEFKAKALGLIGDVWRTKKKYVITKRGEPIARIIPFSIDKKTTRRGSLKGLMEIHGDIVHHDFSSEWEVLGE